MALKFQLQPVVRTVPETFRLGTIQQPLTQADRGKAVTLSGPNQMTLAEADDEIFGFVTSVEDGTHDGFVIGGVQQHDFALVDTGTAAVGDVVTVDTNPALGVSGKTKVKTATATPLVAWVVVRPGLVQRY